MLDKVTSELGMSRAQSDQQGVLSRVRLVETLNARVKPPLHEIMIEVVTDKGKVLASQSFHYAAHQFKSSVEADGAEKP